MWLALMYVTECFAQHRSAGALACSPAAHMSTAMLHRLALLMTLPFDPDGPLGHRNMAKQLLVEMAGYLRTQLRPSQCGWASRTHMATCLLHAVRSTWTVSAVQPSWCGYQALHDAALYLQLQPTV